MARKLKVFRTSVGFRDAYVAAPSQAAALRAWGTEKNLFARGGAELVTDAHLTAEALSKPGEVVYRTRGGLTEQVAALGEMPGRAVRKSDAATSDTGTKPHSKPGKRKRPRPSRAKLEAAEQAMAELDDARARAETALREREQTLAAERAEMERRFAEERDTLRSREQKAKAAYQKALKAWEP